MKSPNHATSPSDNVYINNSHAADDDGDRQQNEPLFNNSIKMGPFSIRYSPSNKKKKKRYTNDNDLQYEDKREGREILHDFAMTQSVFDIEDDCDDCDGNDGLVSSRRRIPLRIILLGESLYNVVAVLFAIYIARLFI